MSDDVARTALVAQLFSTLPLTGLIWLIQRVSYPLFAEIGREMFVRTHAAHSTRITPVVAPLMCIELVASVTSVLTPMEHYPRPVALLGLALVVVAWSVTAFLSVPQHRVLARDFDARAHRVLVSTNWLRVFAWSARSALLLVVVNRMIH
jgi:hypothetical protein